jgi:hypothetical protein
MEFISTAVSALSLVLASAAFISSRKSFLLTIANQRSQKVNEVFKIKSKDGLSIADKKSDTYVWYWTDIISEIVISNNILEMTAGNFKLVRRIYGINNVQKIFWEQLHTSIREHFKNYNELDLHVEGSDTKNTLERKLQIKTIVNRYIKN